MAFIPPVYPYPVPLPPRPRIISVEPGSIYGPAPHPLCIQVSTCAPGPVAYLDGVELETQSNMSQPPSPSGRGMLTSIVVGPVDKGVHLVTVNDATGISDAVQLLVY